jgi:hypothetical protein
LDQRRYNEPTSAEVALFLPDGPERNAPRDVVVHLQGGGLHFINPNHPMYDPLHFVLFHTQGPPGWHPDIPLEHRPDRQGGGDNRTVSAMQWAAYHCQERIYQSTHLLRGRRILHGWICDAYSKVEAARLNWLRFNQVAIRAELYSGIQDAVCKTTSLRSCNSWSRARVASCGSAACS